MRPIATALIFCCLHLSGSAKDGDLSELGLPSPVKVEIVFPQIVLGEVDVEFETDILALNSTPNEAYVEFNLYTHTGFPAKKRVVGSRSPRSFDVRTTVEPGRVRSFDLPPRRLTGSAFVGWGVLRSNENVEAIQTIRILELGSRRLLWEADIQGNSKRVENARFPLQANSGLSVVNPDFSESVTLAVPSWRETSRSDPDADPELLEERQIFLKPRNQRTIMLHELFDSVNAASFVKIVPVSGAKSFAFASLFFRFEGSSGYRVYLPGASSSRRWLRTVVTAEEPWEFPVKVVDSVRIRGQRILLSAFALYVLDADGNPWGPFNVNGAPRLVVNRKAGIVVAQGVKNRLAILFADSKKVIYEHLPGELGSITQLPDLNTVEIFTSGIVSVGCCVASAGTYILIDKATEEVIERFYWFQSGTPPWRE